MPKIRGVKPDYWTDEAIVDLSIPARLLLIGLWNYACDNGHLQDKPKQIKMRIFPGDDVNATALLRELEASGRIKRDDGWITIPNLTHHQKPDVRYFTTCDKEGCDDPPEKVSQRAARRAHTVHTPSTQGAPTVRTPGARGDGDGDGEVMVKVKGETPSRKRSETPERFEEFWDTYSHKIGRKKAESAYVSALRKGIAPDTLISAAGAYIAFQVREGKHPQFTKHPATWLNGEHWRDERTAAAPVSNVQRHLQLAADLAQREQGPQPPQFQPRQIGPAS